MYLLHEKLNSDKKVSKQLCLKSGKLTWNAFNEISEPGIAWAGIAGQPYHLSMQNRF